MLFQKLKDAKKNPVFMLKHIKDIRSPIAVAQQKHAARKASSVMTTDSNMTTATHGHTKSPSTARTINRPPRLEVQDLSTPTPMMSSLSPQPGWPDSGALSPAVDGHSRDEMSVAPGSASTQGTHLSTSTTMTGSTLVGSISHGAETSRLRGSEPGDQPPSARDVPVASTGVSYAVAIYPYMAEQEDEFDVVV